MSKYSVNVDELKKAVAISNHVIQEFDKAGKQLKEANDLLRNQSGFGINDDKITLGTQTAVLNIQRNNMERIRDYIQLVIDTTLSTVEGAKKEMESVNFEGIKEAEVLGGENQNTISRDNGVVPNAGNNQSHTGGANSSRKMFYNCTYYGESDPRSIYNVAPTDKYGDTENSCMVNAYAMLMNSLGIDVLPGDIYSANGNTNLCTHNYMASFGVQSSGVRHDGLALGNEQGNEQRIYNILQEHPEGIIIGNSNAPHYVYAYLDGNGSIKINDPGQVNPANGWYGGEGISIDKTWSIGSWGRVNSYVTVSQS